MKLLTRLAFRAGCAVFALTVIPIASAQMKRGEDVLKNVCSACHSKGDGGYERIDDVRKTPEAWAMTVARMKRIHNVALNDDQYIAVVRHLASTRGLSVEETDGRRYVLEKEPVATDATPNQLMAETCGRCHSYARVALQRRAAEDWEKLINFHLGQFPSLEIQALGRDRDWWKVAHDEVLPYLIQNYPLGELPEVSDKKLADEWVFAGHKPGRGDYSGKLLVSAARDGYDVRMDISYDDSSEVFEGHGILLGEGEWRASLSNGDTNIRQVFALTSDGELSGRWFETKNEVSGGRFVARPSSASTKILAASPAYIRVGVPTKITLTGVGLSGKPELPDGIVAKVISQQPDKVELELTASKSLAQTKLGMGNASVPFVVFSSLDRIVVEPDVTISRVGGNGGPIPKVPAQFEAIGYLNGEDGKPDTEDDIRVGVFTAAWEVDNWDEVAAAMEDVKFAGSINKAGLFTPAAAGPNPKRPRSTNNTGNLKVIATVDDQGQQLSGEAHLYATVQRFIDPPIR